MWLKGGVLKLPDKARGLARDAVLGLVIAGYTLLGLAITRVIQGVVSRFLG